MKTIHAVYENGIFRPTTPVDLPEGCEVTIEPRRSDEPVALSPHQKRIHELLGQSVDTGDPYLSERHDEHQP
jgi:predicted DNA-binding antitoxin AbrB/MazE fold protein